MLYVNSPSRRELQSQREQLMKKLMEAELDSSAAAKQTASLKETLKKLEVCVSVLYVVLLALIFSPDPLVLIDVCYRVITQA